MVLDEAHRARRKNLVRGQEYGRAQPNNLLAFMQAISPRTRSLLLGTATPVQIHPIEAWDLLDVLSRGSESILGGPGSHWRRPQEAIETLLGARDLPDELHAMWDWIRNPLPPANEGPIYQIIRRRLGLSSADVVVSAERFDGLSVPEQEKIRRRFNDFIRQANPFIRYIVLRRRDYLENTLDPETGEPYLQPVGVRLHGDAEGQAISMPPFFRDAYELAEEFCTRLAQRSQAAGYFRTLLLRRFGSTIEAGKRTVTKLLKDWQPVEEDDVDDDNPTGLGTLDSAERAILERLISALDSNKEPDPKLAILRDLLIRRGWLELGCIVFTQYFDSADWLMEQLLRLLPEEAIGLYAGAGRSQIAIKGERRRCDREEIKRRVAEGEIRLLIGTDAAAEGLNLQRLGTLVNLDLPWNPSRLEQRKGRIQRIGQSRDTVDIFNMRYRGSVEDRVHHMLSDRLEAITSLFGQLPDILEDVWIQVALGNQVRAEQTIDAVPDKHPFELRYRAHVEPTDWESYADVLNSVELRDWLKRPWY